MGIFRIDCSLVNKFLGRFSGLFSRLCLLFTRTPCDTCLYNDGIITSQA